MTINMWPRHKFQSMHNRFLSFIHSFIFQKVFVQNFLYSTKFIVQKLVLFFFFIPSLSCQKIQRTNHLRYLLFPLTKIQGTNCLRILCLNILEGTSFVVQVECTSTWVVILRTREGTSLVDQFKWRVHPLGCSKSTREGTSLVDLCL